MAGLSFLRKEASKPGGLQRSASTQILSFGVSSSCSDVAFLCPSPDKITDGNISFKNTIRGCVVKFEVTAPQKMSFFEVFNEFLDKHLDWAPLSGHYKVLARLLRRFELYRQKTTRTKFTLILNDFDSTEIERFKDFVINEPKIYYKYPSIYKAASDVVETA